MPGLKELEYFRKELSKLGNEREVTAERGEIYDELPMPNESAPLASQVNVDDLLSSLGGGTSEEGPTGEESSFVPPESSDFENLLASLDLGEPSDSAGAKTAPESAPASESAADEFAIPEDLLSGFADEVTASRNEADDGFMMPSLGEEQPATEEPVAELPEAELPDETFPSGGFELPSFDNEASAEELTPEELTPEPAESMDFADLTPSIEMDLPPSKEAEPETPEELGELGELGESGDSGDVGKFDLGNLDNLGDLGDFGVPSIGEDAGAGEVEPEPLELGDEFKLPDLSEPAGAADAFPPPGDISPSVGDESPASAFGDGFADFTIPADLNIDESTSAEEPAAIDGFDGFSLDEDFLKTSLGESESGDEEFHIPGFSDFTSTPARASLSEFPTAAVGGKRGGKKEIPLQISESDLAKFLALLALYPLNLRIAVEEYLSGTAGTELQKMELVHSILNNASVKRVAHVLEDALSRVIVIPKDFEKKSVEEYEKEKSSLRYVIKNRILPAATLFTLVSVLVACTVFLGYRFIYKPIVAETLYQKGYAAIEDARYTQSIEYFDLAVKEWEKKKWYFKYASAYRKHKQFINAELMYERVVARYPRDRSGYLEYAEMLRTELRNFEKAEEVLKRRMLVEFVNDRDGLLLLGDNYLDWAEEDPSKFEAARLTYATLIERYGPEDPFLARMMRYFIRTDNLAEVLPLKDHFMSKRAKIGAADLVELGGYLIDKRYNPKPGDSEALRSRIEDVKRLLERALKADRSSPEANYNMGRFLIYNYKYELAAVALEESLRLFEDATTMSPKRVFTHVDAFRLAGEALIQSKRYLDAQSYYARGISLYEEQRMNRSVRQDRRIGVLYSDYADVDYFVSNDLDSALVNYRKAVSELNDTASIRYRIGYVEYQKQDYESAIADLAVAHSRESDDQNTLFGYGNALFRRGDYFAAQGLYERLMDNLENEKIRKGVLLPQIREDHGEFVERYMHSANNLGVILNRLAARTGDSQKNGRALALLADSARAWDALTRNPKTLVRAQGANLAFLNIQNMTHPRSTFVPEIYSDIPKTLDGEKPLE